MSNETRNTTSSSADSIIMISLFVGHFLVSLVGNSLIIAVVYKNYNKKMRTIMNLFVVNMAASDLLTTVFSLPIQFALFAFGSEALRLHLHQPTVDLFICQIHPSVWFTLSGVSLLSHVAISLDRFWAVFYPTKRPLTSRKPSVVFVAIWLFCLCFAFIPTFIWDTLCSKPSIFSIGFVYLYFAFYLALPAIAILFLYPAILIKLWNRKIPGNPSVVNQDLRDRTNLKVTIMAVALVVSFAVSWFPYLAQVIYDIVQKKIYVNDRAYPDKEEVPGIHTVAVVLTFSSCMWNPLICMIFNANFREGFKTILRTLCSCFSVAVGKCNKKNEITALPSGAIVLGQDLCSIQVAGIRNLKEN